MSRWYFRPALIFLWLTLISSGAAAQDFYKDKTIRFIVGQGVVFGARRHTSIVLVAVSVVLTLVALALSEYLIVAHFVSQELGFAVDLVQPPDVFFGVIGDSLGADPLTLVFWAIALFQAFIIPWRSIREG